MPTTQGSEINCKESDETVVAVKYEKSYGAKGRNTITFLEGKHVQTLEVERETWQRNNKI